MVGVPAIYDAAGDLTLKRGSGARRVGNFPVNSKKYEQGDPPALVHITLLRIVPAGFHVVKDPVPHDEETGDDHVGEQPGTEECSNEHE